MSSLDLWELKNKASLSTVHRGLLGLGTLKAACLAIRSRHQTSLRYKFHYTQYVCPHHVLLSLLNQLFFFFLLVENSPITYLNDAKYKVIPLEIKNRAQMD